jgi:hypothetical protein
MPMPPSANVSSPANPRNAPGESSAAMASQTRSQATGFCSPRPRNH